MTEKNCTAIVIGSNGGIGGSVFKRLKNSEQYEQVLGFNRNSKLKVDITNEQDLQNLRDQILEKNLSVKILFNAVGFLHDNNYFPEKKVENINIAYMKKSFLINSIGSALLIKYIANTYFPKLKIIDVDTVRDSNNIALSSRLNKISSKSLQIII